MSGTRHEARSGFVAPLLQEGLVPWAQGSEGFNFDLNELTVTALSCDSAFHDLTTLLDKKIRLVSVSDL